MPLYTTPSEYEQGKQSILEWLEVSRAELIPWKIQICLDNYPSNPRYQPYYDAMLEELRKRLAVQQ